MFSLRTHVFICLGLFVAMIGLAIAGNIAADAGMIPPQGAGPVAIVVFFGLFVAFGFSCVPVIVKTVFRAQTRLGNAGKEPVKSLMSAENVIIWVMWAIMALGMAIAIPGAILSFNSEPPQASAPSSPPP